MDRHRIFPMCKQNIDVLWSQVLLRQALSAHLNRGNYMLKIYHSYIKHLCFSFERFSIKTNWRVLDLAGSWIGQEFSKGIVTLHWRLVKAKTVLERRIWVSPTCLYSLHRRPCNSFGISTMDDPKFCIKWRSGDQRRRSHAYALHATRTVRFSPPDSY